MGQVAAGGPELAATVLSGSFTGTGNSNAAQFMGGFNVSLSGTFSGTVILERSFDGGQNFFPCAIDTAGDPNAYTAPLSMVVSEPEPGVYYRLRCSAFVSGTINYRLSAGPRLT